jgi:hypothetical protein
VFEGVAEAFNKFLPESSVLEAASEEQLVGHVNRFGLVMEWLSLGGTLGTFLGLDDDQIQVPGIIIVYRVRVSLS